MVQERREAEEEQHNKVVTNRVKNVSSEPELILRCKVAVCGDGAVGKSSLVQMFASRGAVFPKNYKLTAGVDVSTVKVAVPGVKAATVELFLHDTGGDEVFVEDAHKYWDSLGAIILVFDLTSRESLMNCGRWLDSAKSQRTDRERPINGILVGNKLDLVARRAVNREEAANWAQEHGLEYCEVSALPPASSLETPFTHVASRFYSIYEEKVSALKGIVT